MWKHYLKTGFRNLYRQKIYSLINILGLSTGLASFILILLFLQNELSYERHIPGSENIYRLVEIQRPAGIDVQHVAITSGPWAAELRNSLPEVKDALRLMPVWGGLYRVDDKVFGEQYAYYAEQQVFRFFNLTLVAGDPETILSELHTAVISERIADNYFNSRDVIGKTFRYGNQPYRVTGLMAESTGNSHLKFEILLSFSSAEEILPDLKNWGNNYLSTYVMLREGVDKEHAEENLHKMIDLQMNSMGMEDAPRPDMYLQPLREIHLKSQHIKFSIYNTRGDIKLIYLFSLVAFLILLIACINFINLSTARSAKRAMEVGIRKVLGAGPQNLIFQFIGESVIMVFLALIIAIGLVEIILPDFNALLETSLNIDFVGNWIFNLGLIVLLLLVGLLAGTYPAFYLSRFQPVAVLKNASSSSKTPAGILRKILVVFQFGISSILVLITLVIFNQWHYMVHKDLGVNYQNVLSMYIQQDGVDEIKMATLKNDLLSHPAFVEVAIASGTNGVAGSQGPVNAIDSVLIPLMVRYGYVDHDYFTVMEIPVVMGRNFNPDYGTDRSQAVIINQAAVRALNWSDPIGRKFQSPFNPEENLEVIGVVQDYNYYSLHGIIEPAFYLTNPERLRTIVARYNQAQRDQALEHAREVWAEYFPGLPFEPEFANENLERQYRAEANTMKVFTYFSMLCMIISALGLYGLTSYVAEQKRREIGIRKVHGAGIRDIIVFLQKDFMVLVLIAFAIAAPIGFIFASNWLNNFAYRIKMQWWHFGIALAVVSLVAFLTVIYHALKAAKANPVESMKYE
ncbi:MAG: ABC transporter permease [Bacteroides sp.]|jgi:putative ABC transport system permease protein|nr:ABC transporter permease [Bacteroides sp.]